jgi:hypothetical protein
MKTLSKKALLLSFAGAVVSLGANAAQCDRGCLDKPSIRKSLRWWRTIPRKFISQKT